MADEMVPLIEEIKKTNALTTQLLKEKIADDTPGQIFRDALPEVFAEYDSNKQATKLINSTQVKESDDVENLLDVLIEGFLTTSHIQLDHFKVASTYMTEMLSIANNLLSPRGIRDSLGRPLGELVKGFQTGFAKYAKEQNEQMKDFEEMFGDVHEDIREAREQRAAEATQTELRDEENKKDKDAKDKTFLHQIGEYFSEPVKGLKEGFNDLTDGLLGKAGVTTALLLGLSGLLFVFKPAADALAQIINGVGNFFGDIGKVFAGDMSFSDFFFNNITSLMVTVLLPFSKTFRKFIGFFTKILKRFIAVPLLIINAALGFFEEVDKAFSNFANDPTFGNFLELLTAPIRGIALGLIDGLKGLLIGAVELLVPDEYVASVTEFVTNIIDSIREFFATILSPTKLFNFVKNLFKGDEDKPEGMAMGGPVAAGTPYIVGEKGPELFVPGAAGGIMPGLGGGNIVVNNNQVNQSAQTANHQHSNVTIVDRQQEQVGL